MIGKGKIEISLPKARFNPGEDISGIDPHIEKAH